MATRRKDLIDSENPGFYHLISRCVRRAWLCGVDKESGRSYEHRRQWIEDRILELAEIFSVEIYGYAVMDNHYHVVVYSNPKLPQQWSDEEVAERWLQLYPGKTRLPKYAHLREAKKAAIMADDDKLAEYRKRLGSVSWFMRSINEPIAKNSNKEDCVKGHFFESRFTSQALLDEAAALTCLAYVDLNPVRAGIAKTPEESAHTGIQRRLRSMTQAQLDEAITAIAGKVRERPLTLKLRDYIELVDWTGKQIVHPGKASIPAHLLPIMERLNINPERWQSQVQSFGSNFYQVVGPLDKIKALIESQKQIWKKGIRSMRELYLTVT